MPQTDEQRARASAYYAANKDRIRAYQRERWAENRSAFNERQRQKYAENAAERVAYQQAWREANRSRVNELARAARYGLSLDQLHELYEASGHSCQGCGVAEADAPRGSLYVDHDHGCCPGARACGSCVRGLLCLNCNTTLGRCGDDPDVLIRLARYLSERAAPRDDT